MQSLGINIGSSSIKVVLLDDKNILWKTIDAHEGNFIQTLKNILIEKHVSPGLLSLVTGTEGRYLLNMNNMLESICIEEALKQLNLNVDAVVSLGGENFIVYTIDEDGRIITSFAGNKCASGTGEFFKQQLGRMDLRLCDVEHVPDNAKVCHMSSRCSVFMKSDCTHKLNKGEATKADIVLSLSDVMATKVADFLKRARIRTGNVLLAGGVSRNRYIIQFVKDKLPGIEFIAPDEAPYLEAFGAAHLARISGSRFPGIGDLFKPQEIEFARYRSLTTVEGRVKYLKSKRGTVKPGREYILGVDGGSTTTKVALIDIETDEIVACHYGRTHGDPVNALKECLIEVKKQLKEQIGDPAINITIASTTGSSREILGVFLETPAVYNEIIAHAVGTTYFKPDIRMLNMRF